MSRRAQLVASLLIERRIVLRAARIPADYVAAADDEIGMLAHQQLEHLRKQVLIVLQISIHDRDELRLARQRALDEGAGQAAATHPPDTADPCVALTELLGDSGSVIRGIVVDEDELPGGTIKANDDALHQQGTFAASLNVGTTTVSTGPSRLRRVDGGRHKRLRSASC